MLFVILLFCGLSFTLVEGSKETDRGITTFVIVADASDKEFLSKPYNVSRSVNEFLTIMLPSLAPLNMSITLITDKPSLALMNKHHKDEMKAVTNYVLLENCDPDLESGLAEVAKATVKRDEYYRTRSQICYKKVRMLLCTPYKHTLFMEADTMLCHKDNIKEQVDELFGDLNTVDFAGMKAVNTHMLKGTATAYEMNIGVLLYVLNSRVRYMVELFGEEYIARLADSVLDQPALRPAMDKAAAEGLKYKYLDFKWNCLHKNKCEYVTNNETCLVLHGHKLVYAINGESKQNKYETW